MKLIKFVFIICILVYLVSLGYILYFSLSPKIPAHADAILILGAKVNLNNTPSDPLYERTAEAVRLYKLNKADFVIATGGVGLGSLPESKVEEKIAVSDGVPSGKLLGETISHNTFENIEDIQTLAAQHNIHSVIVVSDRFHVARGVFVARNSGFNSVYWDYPNMGYLKPKEIFWDYVREAAALIAYIPKVYFRKF